MLDRIPIPDVAFHDFSYILRCFHAVPDTLRIDDDRGAEGTGIKASGLVRSYTAFQLQTFDFLFEYLPQLLGPFGGAAAPWIRRLTTILADENMTYKSRHASHSTPRPSTCQLPLLNSVDAVKKAW